MFRIGSPLPALPLQQFPGHEIISSVLIGFDLDGKQRDALAEVKAFSIDEVRLDTAEKVWALQQDCEHVQMVFISMNITPSVRAKLSRLLGSYRVVVWLDKDQLIETLRKRSRRSQDYRGLAEALAAGHSYKRGQKRMH